MYKLPLTVSGWKQEESFQPHKAPEQPCSLGNGQDDMLKSGLVDMWMEKYEVRNNSGRLALIAQEGLAPICISAVRKSCLKLAVFHGADAR